MKDKSKLKPYTVDEYNEFLIFERKNNETSLNMTVENHSKDKSSSVKKVKKEKKKKEKSSDAVNSSKFEESFTPVEFQISPKRQKKHSKKNIFSSIHDNSIEQDILLTQDDNVSSKKIKSQHAQDVASSVKKKLMNKSDQKKHGNYKLKSPIKTYESDESLSSTEINRDFNYDTPVNKGNNLKNKSNREQEIHTLNNLSDNSSVDEEVTSNSKKLSNSVALNKSNEKNISKASDTSKANDDSESDDEIVNKKYSFQFNRSYEFNVDDKIPASQTVKREKKLTENQYMVKERLLNKHLNVKQTFSKEIDISPSPIGIKKSNLFKNIVNSTALDISSVPDTSFPNISQIPSADKTVKADFYDLTEQEIKEPDNAIIKQYVEKNEKLIFKKISKQIKFDGDASDEEVYIVQCPRNINPALLIDQNIYNSSFQYDGAVYNLTTIQNPIKQVSMFVPGHTQGAIKSYPLVGNIVIQSEIKPASIKKMKKLNPSPVEFPENLKIRHPLFGKRYKKKIILQPHVVEELLSKKKKKSRKHKKQVQDDMDDMENDSKSTMKRKLSSEHEEYDALKRKKKRKIKHENLWNSNDDIERNLFNV